MGARRFDVVSAGKRLACYYQSALACCPRLGSLYWYVEQADAIGDMLGRPASPRELVALAVLSPETHWGRLVSAFTDDVRHGRSLEGLRRIAYPSNVDKALRVMYGPDADALSSVNPRSSPKVHAFSRAFLGDCSAVTVDRHSAAIVLGRPLRARREYDDVALAHYVASSLLGVPAREVQARTWVAWRDRGFRAEPGEVVYYTT